MKTLQRFVECMQKGDPVGLADLFAADGVFHDASWNRVGMDTVHLEGKMAVEMLFHHKFGVNGGPFPISGVQQKDQSAVWYFIQYDHRVVQVMAYLSEVDENGLIKRMNVYSL